MPRRTIRVMDAPAPIIETTIEPWPPSGTDRGSTPEGAGIGASCRFVGTTRPERHDRFGELEALEYESAGPLAESLMRALAVEVATRHDLLALRVVHAIGRVPVGEASVWIEASAAHRASAFDGCREMIDRLKREIPIWKRERWREGTTWSPDAAIIERAGS